MKGTVRTQILERAAKSEKKMKKKFDNLIADAKKNCSKLFVFAELN